MRQSERGSTLVELMVVVAVGAILAAAVGTSVALVVRSTERGRNHMTTLRQVQTAGYWVGRDTAMARTVSTGDNPETPGQEFITLSWTDWEDGDVHETTYTLEAMTGEMKRLHRRHVIRNVEGVEIQNTTTFVAENVLGSSTFGEQDGVWELLIGVTSGAHTETRGYKVNPRVNM